MEVIRFAFRKVSIFAIGLLTTAILLTANSVFADGAQVLRSSPVGISNVDNPCTIQVESLNFTGFLQQVQTPSGNTEFHTVLKSSDGSNLIEVFTGPLSNSNTRFREILATPGVTPNAMFDGEFDSNGNLVSSALTCLGPQS